jgi:hypothetical protein
MKYTALVIAMLITNLAHAEIKLSWEEKNPKNSEWTKITLAAINSRFNKLNQAEDAELFCPEYTFLDEATRKQFWGEFISAMAFYESGWNLYSQLTEISLGNDSVTGKVVTSEGLLQLSYGDTKWATWCNFNWEEDNLTNPVLTTILNPKNNLECGIGILANQIRKHHRIVLEKRAYWSILKTNHKFQKIDAIRKMITTRIPQCTKQK